MLDQFHLPNSTVPNFKKIETESLAAYGGTFSNLILTPGLSGSIIGGPPPDNTALGGNVRGLRSLDLQLGRSDAFRVANNAYSYLIGYDNYSDSTNVTSNVIGPSISIGVGNSNTQAQIPANSSIAIGYKNMSGFSGGNAYSGNTVAIGTSNLAYQANSISIGVGNASYNWGISIGTNNTSPVATVNGIAIGTSNSIGGSNKNYAIAIGKSNNPSQTGGDSAIALGTSNVTTASYGIAIGSNGLADRIGMRAYSTVTWPLTAGGAAGDNQVVDLTLQCRTTTSAVTEMTLSNIASAYLTIPSGKGMGFIASVFGIRSTDGAMAHFVRKAAIRNNGTDTAFSSTPSIIGSDDNPFNCGFSMSAIDLAGSTSDYLSFRVNSPDSTGTWRWIAHVEGVETVIGT